MSIDNIIQHDLNYYLGTKKKPFNKLDYIYMNDDVSNIDVCESSYGVKVYLKRNSEEVSKGASVRDVNILLEGIEVHKVRQHTNRAVTIKFLLNKDQSNMIKNLYDNILVKFSNMISNNRRLRDRYLYRIDNNKLEQMLYNSDSYDKDHHLIDHSYPSQNDGRIVIKYKFTTKNMKSNICLSNYGAKRIVDPFDKYKMLTIGSKCSFIMHINNLVTYYNKWFFLHTHPLVILHETAPKYSINLQYRPPLTYMKQLGTDNVVEAKYSQYLWEKEKERKKRKEKRKEQKKKESSVNIVDIQCRET